VVGGVASPDEPHNQCVFFISKLFPNFKAESSQFNLALVLVFFQNFNVSISNSPRDFLTTHFFITALIF